MRKRPRIKTTCVTSVTHAARVAACACLVLAWAGPSARAGIVNVQSSLATEADEGLSGSISGAVDWRTGNVDRLSLSLAPVARYRRGDNLFIALASGEFFRTEGINFDQRIFEHLRYRRTLTDWVLGEAFVQHEFNDRRRLQLRAVAGAGPRGQLLDRDRVRLGVGVAYMFEYERLDDGDPALIDAGDTHANHRISSYLTGSYEADDRLLLVGTVYGQPRMDDLGDIKALVESQIVLKLSTHLSFTTSFSLSYDSEPPDTVESLDTRLQSGITYDF